MSFKINISGKSGKTFKIEAEAEGLIEKKLHDIVKGEEILKDLEGYEFEITGTSDSAGFPSMKDVKGVGLKRVLLNYGKFMHVKPKGDKKKGTKPKGLRLRKSVRGEIISPAISQINLKITKEGLKKLGEIFPDQNKVKVKENRAFKRKQKSEESKREEVKEETKNEEVAKPEEEKVEEKKE